MVGVVGLAPTKAVRPGNLQSPAIAAMRYSQKKFVYRHQLSKYILF